MKGKKQWTGERWETDVQNETAIEHLHRYALAMELSAGKAVLDIACGEGYGSRLLAANAAAVTAWIPANFLNTGSYLVSTTIFNYAQKIVHLHERDVLRFTVNEVFEGVTARGKIPWDFLGIIRPILK